MNDRWVDLARRELLDRRGALGVWGYRPGGSPAAEPTALAALSLSRWGCRSPASSTETDEWAVAQRAGEWLADLQRADGSVPVAAGPAMPGWATPLAMLVWAGLDGFELHRSRARDWLLGMGGRPLSAPAGGRGIVGHDLSLVGWPWVPETHSWIEPTATAILALCGERCRDHPRVARGLSLIRDRAIPGGGWNYGNRVIFGQALRPQPAPTGIALLALAAGGCADGAVVPAALEYLRRVLPTLRAAASVGWGVLGLKAHRACPAEAASWLAEAHERCTGRPDATVGLSLLLLASGRQSSDPSGTVDGGVLDGRAGVTTAPGRQP